VVRYDARGHGGSAVPAAPATIADLGEDVIAILDALKMFPAPIVELHISNIHRREQIYHRSLVSGIATAVIAGLGPEGYGIAVSSLKMLIAKA
jgi:3-dehydroquinate dehydratase-2